MFNIFRRLNCCWEVSKRCRDPRPQYKRLQCKCTREVFSINEITYDELLRKVKEGAILIDVRTRQEFLEGHLEGAILIPYYEVFKKVENLLPNKEQTIIVYCQNGGRSQKAYKVLNRLGYSNIYNLKDGIEGI